MLEILTQRSQTHVFRNIFEMAKTREKNVATNENCILRKMGLKFQNPSFNNLCKIALWIKQKWLSEELIIWSGLPR